MKQKKFVLFLLLSLFLLIASLIFSYGYTECGAGNCSVSLFDRVKGKTICALWCVKTYSVGWPFLVWTKTSSGSRLYLENLLVDCLFYFLVSLPLISTLTVLRKKL